MMAEGVGVSKRQPYGGRPHQSHCTCNNKLAEVQTENARLRAERNRLDYEIGALTGTQAIMIDKITDAQHGATHEAEEANRLRDEIVWMRQRAERAEAQVTLLRATHVHVESVQQAEIERLDLEIEQALAALDKETQ